MKIGEHLLSGLQGFAAGGIVMAYINNYNRSQLPIALVLLIFSILTRLNRNK